SAGRLFWESGRICWPGKSLSVGNRDPNKIRCREGTPLLDTSQSMTFDNEADNVLTEEMLDGVFDPSMMEDMPLDGLDAREFATMVAETASAFLPAGADPEEFKRRYVSMTTPLLKI